MTRFYITNECYLDCNSKTLVNTRDCINVELSPQEYEVLLHFMKNEGMFLTLQQISDATHYSCDKSTISYLRKRLKTLCANPDLRSCIKTQRRGFGMYTYQSCATVDDGSISGYEPLIELMQKTTAPCFDSVSELTYSLGENKSVCQQVGSGWKLDDVFLEQVDNEKSIIPAVDFQEYQRFLESGFQLDSQRDLNLNRWMLTRCLQIKGKLHLSLKRTDWSQTRFYWEKLRNHETYRKMEISNFFCNKKTSIPNSFCLHLVLITNDEKIVTTRISANKQNDYPSKLAVTIGEQIEEIDFSGVKLPNNTFVEKWAKRALCEEFGFNPIDFNAYVKLHSARVLALNAEGDIFNFSLLCILPLKCNIERFEAYCRSHGSASEELYDISVLSPAEAVEILTSSDWHDCHPSTPLRLLYGCISILGLDKLNQLISEKKNI